MEQAVIVRESVATVVVKREGRPDVLVQRQIASGPPGARGPVGPPGDSNTVPFEFPIAQEVWLIAHNLGHNPQTTVVDGGGEVVLPKIVHLSTDLLEIRHSLPTTGRVFLL